MASSLCFHHIYETDSISQYMQRHLRTDGTRRYTPVIECGDGLRIAPDRAALLCLIKVSTDALTELDAALAADEASVIASSDGE